MFCQQKFSPIVLGLFKMRLWEKKKLMDDTVRSEVQKLVKKLFSFTRNRQDLTHTRFNNLAKNSWCDY